MDSPVSTHSLAYDGQSVQPSSASAAARHTDAAVRPTHVRHYVLALTVAAYMLTYMDRVVISSAVPAIQKEFGFSIVTMGWILGSFRWAYSAFQIPVAWFGDRYGPRRALTAIVLWWSVLTSATTMAWSAASMIAIRFLFGAGEAGAFPIATRSLSRWMPPSERGFAQGITHAGSRLGAALTPALVAVIIAKFGWRAGVRGTDRAPVAAPPRMHNRNRHVVEDERALQERRKRTPS